MGEMCFASIKAGISAPAVSEIWLMTPVQHKVAAPNIKRVDKPIPLLTDDNLFCAPISEIKAANHKITKPPYDAPEAIGLPLPTCFINSAYIPESI